MPTPAQIHSTTQQFLDIYDITNDLLIMKDGAVALVLNVSAINFGLFAEEEQDAVIYAYAGLINSLNYPIQIVVRSQTKDITSYLQLLKDQEDQAGSPLRKQQIAQYRAFVSDLIRERNVLDKKFYVVIPASALEMGLLPPSSVIPGVKKTDVSTVERSLIIEKARNILEPKRDHLMAQLGRIGLFAKQLTTQDIIQLFYLSYNPEASDGQQVTDTRSYTTPVVSARMQLQNLVTGQTAAAAPTPAPEPLPQPAYAPEAAATDPMAYQQPQAVAQPVAPQPEPAPTTPVTETAPTPVPEVPVAQPVEVIAPAPAVSPTPLAPPATPVQNQVVFQAPAPTQPAMTSTPVAPTTVMSVEAPVSPTLPAMPQPTASVASVEPLAPDPAVPTPTPAGPSTISELPAAEAPPTPPASSTPPGEPAHPTDPKTAITDITPPGPTSNLPPIAEL
ncbi:MAG TPA: hypothetical protein VD999_02310 [Vitreimonas sp.]|nr:hypothetical protein [Vitreimonas sp.]